MYIAYCLIFTLIIILVLIQLSYNQDSGYRTNGKKGSIFSAFGSGYGANGSFSMSKEGFTNADGTYSGLTNNSDAPWTIDRPTKLIITDILRKIINELNTKTGMSYYFTAYDQLTQEVVSREKTKFTADVFLHEMRNLETKRMIIIFLVNFATKQVEVEYMNFSNAFKLPEKQFMDLAGPELILQDNNLLRNEYHIMGLNKSKIDFSILTDDEGRPKQVPTPTEFQKDFLPLGIDAAAQNPQALFPSRRQSKCWDTHGANIIEKQTSLKVGVNSSPMFKTPYPYFNPTVNLQRTWDTEYKGMFDLVDSSGNGADRGVASFP